MFFPEKMLRVRIMIEPQHSNDVLEAIGKSGLLHIDRRAQQGKSGSEASRANVLLSLVQKYMALLDIEPKKQPIASVSALKRLLDRTEEKLSVIGAEIDALSFRLNDAARETEYFDKAAAVKAALAPMVDIERLSEELRFINVRVAMVGTEATVLLRLAMKQKGLFCVDRVLFEQTNAVAIFCPEEDETAVSHALHTFKAVEIPAVYFSDRAFASQQQNEKLLRKEKTALADAFGEELQQMENRLYAMQALERAGSALREHDNGLLLEGWIPQQSAKTFVPDIRHAAVTLTAAEGEAPVLLQTPPSLKPFETLISSFACPRYGEVNPVVPFAFSFLLLFGIMFGDVGHGLILALVGWLVKKRSPLYADLGQIYYLSGIASAFFGLLYGSVFGVHHLLPHLLFTPIENIHATIVFSIGIGVFIITFSFFLHIVTAVKRREASLLFISEGSILWLLVYWFTIGILVKSLVQHLDITYEAIILALLLLGIFVLMIRKTREKTQAVIDLIREFMDTITNTVSFLRVGAFAMAHGALFMAVFSIAQIISESHGESFFYWISIIVGNSVIIVLEGVVVAIQTLRLEYYEFFKRFFKGGGLPYQPYTLGEKNANQ